MKVLVTGANGFMGKHAVRYLIDHNYSVNIFIRKGTSYNIDKDIIDSVNIYEGDVNNLDNLSKAIKNCEMVYHYAAIVGVDAYTNNKILTMETEAQGLRNITHLALKEGCNKIIYPSSSAIYGAISSNNKNLEYDMVAPISNYAIAKRYNEIYLESQYEEHGLKSICLRIFNVYGPGQDERLVIPRFIKSAISNRPIIIYGDGMQTRDFTYIDDVIRATIICSESVNNYDVINISTGIKHSINKVAKIIINETSSKSKIKLIKLPDKRNSFEIRNSVGDTDKLFKLTGFIPKISLEKGISLTYKYMIDKNIYN